MTARRIDGILKTATARSLSSFFDDFISFRHVCFYFRLSNDVIWLANGRRLSWRKLEHVWLKKTDFSPPEISKLFPPHDLMTHIKLAVSTT